MTYVFEQSPEGKMQDLQDRLDGANDLLDAAYDDLAQLAHHFLPGLTAEDAGMRLGAVVEAIRDVLTVFEPQIDALGEAEMYALLRLFGAVNEAFVLPKKPPVTDDAAKHAAETRRKRRVAAGQQVLTDA